MKSSMQTVLITGASGFLSRACCAAFTAAGFVVCALVRNPAASTDLHSVAQGGVFRCDLPEHARSSMVCPRPTFAPEQALRTNLAGTEALIRLGRRSGIHRLVFVSSMAAHERAASLCGKTKYQLEQRFDPVRIDVTAARMRVVVCQARGP